MTNYTEWTDSQNPALILLRKLGWQYLTPKQCEQERGGILSNVVLEQILEKQLLKINEFDYKGKVYDFSQSSLQSAINALKNVPDEGLVRTNEQIYDLLTLGKSFTENIQGDQKAFTLKYIDWENVNNNVYHVTDEYVVEGVKSTRRPDIVLFVNGIPFVLLENKRRDKNESIEEGISQHIRNQRKDQGAPRIFHYAQLLLAVQPNLVKYGVTGTPLKFWSVWKEDNQKQTEKTLKSKAYDTEPESRLATQQDQSIVSLCDPARVMELVYKFIVFDGPQKKIARYQQYFAVKESLNRIKQTDESGVRKGGVIWHTQGSGKSLTMVMLSKSIALEESIKDPRIILVTDRISLDKQIYKTFLNCGKNVKKAKSGNDLIELLKDKGNENITSILDKFQTALKRKDFKDYSKNLFVLVDESHRGQYGSAHAKMKSMLPNASYIGFTGTPLLKSEKSTARKFGGFIHKYTIDQAVADEAVLPLLYEGRSAKLSVNRQQLDKGFERLAAPLSEEAQKDLKKKFATISKIYDSEQVVEEIAFDISKHFCENWQGTGFKAQLAVPKIDTAIRYQQYFENQTNPALRINSRVVFTPPDSRSDYEDVWKEASSEAKKYWNSLMDKFRGQEEYETDSVDRFKDESNQVELIIVISKLLTGFDAPRNTVLYLAKPLVEHNLLQAIARVNRLFEGKEFGYIIDYVGILGKLDEALTQYSAFEGYEEEDLKGTVVDILTEIRKVPSRLADLWEIFKGISKKDLEAMERYLGPKDIRDSFYQKLSVFARVLQVALSSDEFYKEYNDNEIQEFKNELKFFQKMKTSVQNRYAEVVSYKEYEPRVRKLLDTYVGADYVEKMTEEVNIFDQAMVNEALAVYGKTPASKADMIAHQMKKVITENMEKDEAFYKKFSELIEDTIKAFREGRIDEKEYLERILRNRNDLQTGHQEGLPKILSDKTEARAFYGALTEVLGISHEKEELKNINNLLAQAGIQISEIVEKLTIRDWKRNIDIQNRMENEIEDYLIDHRKALGIEITFDEIDEILSKCLKVAKNNY
ncbi:type I restriction endonuclease subunit R [Algoriphagus zhangzhouensis]|uniref:Type I restriction enzyme endonuclease subunit n=1 Tax=Algoriphagus zhangzhouensis TaxID=1073327 RepID=A0A1M7Z539_9BACT|nr:HsdR family type I site-specific deoxyribonuclease [Algoriphagus zhangzhouensis]TDY48773.1 type I restriction enzyme R subunit [Algoriphagus zhangzhouensis]SHO59932.1 type I restriction enzyme, R subunit [Algoriphagus zhangzhouensis]